MTTTTTSQPNAGQSVHELKTDPAVFDAVARGDKTHEIRLNNRNFQVGDTLLLRETVHTGAHMASAGLPLLYTYRTATRTVSHIQTGYGLADDWCILSFKSAAPVAPEPAAVQEPNQPLIIDEHGVQRFRGNKLVQHLLDNNGGQKIGMNELALVDCSVEDREQFAQLIGYSLSGYGDLSYVTDERFYSAQGAVTASPQPLAEVSAAQAVPYSCETGQIDEALANFLAEHTRLNQDGIDTHAMTMTMAINHAALHPTPEADIAEWREQRYLPPAAQAVPEVAVDEKLCFCKGGLNNHSSGCTEGYPSDLPDYEDYLAKPTDTTKDAS